MIIRWWFGGVHHRITWRKCCVTEPKNWRKKPISLLFNALSFIPFLVFSFQFIWMNAVNSIRWILNRYVHFIVRVFSLDEFIIDASHMNSGQTTTGGNRKMDTNQIKFILVNKYVAIKTFFHIIYGIIWALNFLKNPWKYF